MGGSPRQDSENPELKRWLTTRNVTAVLFVLSLMTYPAGWLGWGSFISRDFGLFGYPLAHYHRLSFWSGEIPHWNPLNFCGLPFLAQWNTMVLYPPSLIYLLLPMPWALTFFCLLHQLLGGVGMFVLGRRWTGNELAGCVCAVAYMFNGLMQNSLMWPNNVAAFGLFPWVLYLLDRSCSDGGRWTVGAALVGACQMLSGAPEIILLTWIVAGLLVLGSSVSEANEESSGSAALRFAMIRFAFVVMLVAGLASVQLLPFLDFVGQSTRIYSEDSHEWSLSNQSLGNFVLPLMNASLSTSGTAYLQGQNWTQSFYPGILILALIGAGMLRKPGLRFWLAVAVSVCAVDLARGVDGVLYPIVDATIGFRFFRFPVKLLILCSMLLPLVGGMAAARLLETKDQGRGPLLVGGVVMMAVLLVLSLVVDGARDGGEMQGGVANAGARFVLLLVGGIAFWMMMNVGGAPRGRIVAGAFCLFVLWFDLRGHLPSLAPTVSRDLLISNAVETGEMYPRPGLSTGRFAMSKESLQQNHYLTGMELEEGFLFHRFCLYDNLNLLDGVPKFGGFYSMFDHRMNDIAAVLYDTVEDGFPSGLADFLGLCQVSSHTNILAWEARISARRLISAGQRPYPVPGKSTAAAVANAGFDPRRIAIIDEGTAALLQAQGSPAALVEDVSVAPHQVRFQVKTSVPTLATIAQTYHKGWKATVDGMDVPLLLVNHAFQGLEIPAGEHVVELRFVDAAFEKGLLVTLGTLILCVFCWWRIGAAEMVLNEVSVETDAMNGRGTKSAAA